MDRLENNYQHLKALKTQNKKSASDSRKHSDQELENSDIEIEIIKIDGEELIKYHKGLKKATKSKYNIKDDLVLKESMERDLEEEDLTNLERPLMRKFNGETCPTAPEERIKHSNYYCMKVIKEDLDVKRKFISI